MKAIEILFQMAFIEKWQSVLIIYDVTLSANARCHGDYIGDPQTHTIPQYCSRKYSTVKGIAMLYISKLATRIHDHVCHKKRKVSGKEFTKRREFEFEWNW